MGKYTRPAKKNPYVDTREIRDKIAELADKIRDGEEDLMEGYNNFVKLHADMTRMQAPARETDPLMYDQLIEDWGRDPGETIQYGGKREMNYIEMTRFMRGYWR